MYSYLQINQENKLFLEVRKLKQLTKILFLMHTIMKGNLMIYM